MHVSLLLLRSNTGAVALCMNKFYVLNIVALVCAETLGPISYTEGEEPCIVL